MTTDESSGSNEWIDPDSAPFSPHVLREYSLIADGERGALIGPHGECAWLCAPHWDSDAVFSSLVGGAGGYAITPAERFVWGGYYETGTLIWRSRWVTETGIIECREALAFPGHGDKAVLLRRVVALKSDARLRVWLDVRAGFGRHPMRDLHLEEGVWTARSGDLHIRWSGAPDARPRSAPTSGSTDSQSSDDAVLADTLTLSAGDHHDFVLELSQQPPGAPEDPDLLWLRTETAWRENVPQLPTSIASDDDQHSYAVLRGLTSSSGGMVAAATTSIPERAEQGRNYDYRYVWLRDQCYAGHALASVGAEPLLGDLTRFLVERIGEHGPKLSPAYTIGGRPIPGEETLDLPGYPGGEVRVGNWVNQQFQLDAYGEALVMLAAVARHGMLDADGWSAIKTCVAAIEQRHNESDAGLWELYDDRWAHSRLACAAGLRAAASVAPRRQAGRWSALADSLVADTSRDCLHPSGRWQRSPGDPRVDCALLLSAVRGAVPPEDPRSRETLAAVRRELEEDKYIYRFRHDQRPRGSVEGAFLLCGFLMALATHQSGDTLEAMRWFERNRAACGPPGLFTEEYDVHQRQLRGNLPQAFVHAMMLEASQKLSRPWRH